MFESSAKKLRFMKYAVIAHAINVRGKPHFMSLQAENQMPVFFYWIKACVHQKES